MTRFLHDFYGRTDDHLSQLIRDFEPLSGHAAVDIKFSDSIRRSQRQLFVNLGLDPTDTTSKELYFALMARAAGDDAKLAKQLNVEPQASESKMSQAVATWMNANWQQSVFVPKRSVIKQILMAKPPKNSLKLLHYRSFDSMFKRCPMTLILAAASLSEPQKWRVNFKSKLANLAYDDFEQRPIEFAAASSKRWQALHKKMLNHNGHAVFEVKPAGGVLLIPSTAKAHSGQTLLFSLAAARAASKLVKLSSLTRRCLVDLSLGLSYADIVSGQTTGANIRLRNIEVQWHHQHRLMGEHADVLAVFEPHLNTDHVSHPAAIDQLHKLTDFLNLWQSSGFLGYKDEQGAVSCNLLDVLQNLIYERPFGAHTTQAMQSNIKHELMHRYLSHDFIKQSLKDKLSVTEPDIPLMLELDE